MTDANRRMTMAANIFKLSNRPRIETKKKMSKKTENCRGFGSFEMYLEHRKEKCCLFHQCYNFFIDERKKINK